MKEIWNGRLKEISIFAAPPPHISSRWHFTLSPSLISTLSTPTFHHHHCCRRRRRHNNHHHDHYDHRHNHHHDVVWSCKHLGPTNLLPPHHSAPQPLISLISLGGSKLRLLLATPRKQHISCSPSVHLLLSFCFQHHWPIVNHWITDYLCLINSLFQIKKGTTQSPCQAEGCRPKSHQAYIMSTIFACSQQHRVHVFWF